MQSKPQKLLYILGHGHSGSTVLDLVLGCHPQIESGGECTGLHRPFATQPGKNDTCTCGAAFQECAYWMKVRALLAARVPAADFRIEGLDDAAVFARNNHLLIDAILTCSGKNVFCDSTKSLDRLTRLLRANLFDIRIVHLIRDGRAVGYSMKSKGEREQKVNALRYNYEHTVEVWQKLNFECHAFLQSYPSIGVTVHYEDFVREPLRELHRITSLFGLTPIPEQLEFAKYPHHIAAGNRMRRIPEQRLQFDGEYLMNLTDVEWDTGTRIGRAALEQWGYPLTRSANCPA